MSGVHMAHIHLEDGAFTPLWIAAWSLVAAALIATALLVLRRERLSPRNVAIAAMCASVGFAVFQVEIPTPLGPVHMNFTPLIGILVGPSLGSIVVLVINLFSAAIGHGGWGMIGPNSIVNIAEVLTAYYLFRMLRVRMGRSDKWSGFIATFLALALSALLVVVIVTISEIQGSELTREQTFANLTVLAAINIGAGAVEGIVTGYVVSFIGRVRPDLLARYGRREAWAAPNKSAGG